MAIHISYTCRECHRGVREVWETGKEAATCPGCGHQTPLLADCPGEGKMTQCPLCGCADLFVRKDFSQRLGVSIVVIGLLLSTVAWGLHWRFVSYAILFGTALCDVVMYFMVGNVLQCYRCQAEYRGFAELKQFEPFDLETYERFRQQALRMAQAKRG